MLTVEWYDFSISSLRRGKLLSVVAQTGRDHTMMGIVIVLKSKTDRTAGAYRVKEGGKLLVEVPIDKLQVLGTEIPLIGDA